MPGSNRVHIDAALSNYAVMYSQKDWFIADLTMPVFKVKKESDKYFKWSLEDITSIPTNTKIADGGEAARVEHDVTNDTYQVVKYGVADLVTQDTIDNADAPITPMQDTTAILSDLIKLDREVRAAGIMFDSATTFVSFTEALTGGDRWDDFANSDPFDKVEDAKESVRQNSLKKANTMIMGSAVFTKLRNHPDILDRIKYTGSMQDPARANELEMAKAFEVDQVIVGRAIYNSANKGQTHTAADVWGKSVNVCYVEQRPSKKSVTAGITFRNRNFRVRRWRDDPAEGTMIEVQIKDDEVSPVPGAGYLLTTVVS